MKQITTDTSTFELFRKQNVLYVDKTAYLYALIAHSEVRKLFFIARPRRFGKSLMLSTLQAIFEGKRELFEGLAISKTDYDWQTYPIVYLDLSGVDVSSVEAAKARIARIVRSALRTAGYESDPAADPASALEEGIRALSKRHPQGIVLLIDEYDGPVGDAFDDLEKANAIRELLATLFVQIKRNEGLLRFAMMTGVTRFASLSIFSKFNSPNDLTVERDFATMLGYTEEELIANFSEHMHAHAQVMGLSDEAYLEKLRTWYDGYRFSPECETRVYNPVAIAKTLTGLKPRFTPTWTTTGHPTLVAQFARRNHTPFSNFAEVEQTMLPLARLDVAALSSVDEIDVLYQTGYLTLDRVFPGDFISLKIPNEEVRQDYKGFLLDVAVGEQTRNAFGNTIARILYTRAFPELFEQLTAFFAKVSYSPTETGYGKVEESNYLRLLQTMLEWSGLKVSVEVNVAGKRADLVLEAMNAVFIFELKRSDNCASAKDAIAQIRANHYAEPYLASGQPIYLIGLVFDNDSHLLADAAVEPYTQA